MLLFILSLEQSLETERTNRVNLNPHTAEHPVTHLDTNRKTAVTPLDMNRFQSKAFHAVISQHTRQLSVSPTVERPLQKEPSLDLDTPSKFLSKDKLFKPSFDVKVRFVENGPVVNNFVVYKVKAPNSASRLKFVVVRFPKILEGRFILLSPTIYPGLKLQLEVKWYEMRTGFKS